MTCSHLSLLSTRTRRPTGFCPGQNWRAKSLVHHGDGRVLGREGGRKQRTLFQRDAQRGEIIGRDRRGFRHWFVARFGRRLALDHEGLRAAERVNGDVGLERGMLHAGNFFQAGQQRGVEGALFGVVGILVVRQDGKAVEQNRPGFQPTWRCMKDLAPTPNAAATPTSATARASSTTISVLFNRWCERLAVAPRELWFRAATADVRAMSQDGARPNARPLSTEANAAKANTRTSSVEWRNPGSLLT